MNISEWIEAAAEVLSDSLDPDGEEDCAEAVNVLLRRFGAHAVVNAVRDASDAALDHCAGGNGSPEIASAETVRALNEVRGHLRMAQQWLERRS